MTGRQRRARQVSGRLGRGRSGRSARSGRAARPSAAWSGVAQLLLLTSPVWVLALRHALAPLVAIEGVGPDVAAAAAAAAAWRGRALPAVLFAAALGCLGDLASDVPFGVAGARLGVLTAAFVHLRHVLQGATFPGASLLVTGAFALLERASCALAIAWWVPAADAPRLLERAAAIGLYSALLGPLAFAVAATLTPGERRR